jgi:hypothetical protein
MADQVTGSRPAARFGESAGNAQRWLAGDIGRKCVVDHGQDGGAGLAVVTRGRAAATVQVLLSTVAGAGATSYAPGTRIPL